MKQLIGKIFRKIVGTVYIFISNIDYRRRMKNPEFSLICNTCIGGVIYHKLNLPFLSPTINTWMTQPDFVKFSLNLREYLSADFEDVGRREWDNVPIGELDGPEGKIRVYFVHYDSFEEGTEKWNERKKRIRFDNLYFITSDGNGLTEEEMRAFDNVQCNNKVIFTAKDYSHIPNTLRLKGFEHRESAATHMLEHHRINTRRYIWEDSFDFVEFLNKR